MFDVTVRANRNITYYIHLTTYTFPYMLFTTLINISSLPQDINNIFPLQHTTVTLQSYINTYEERKDSKITNTHRKVCVVCMR